MKSLIGLGYAKDAHNVSVGGDGGRIARRNTGRVMLRRRFLTAVSTAVLSLSLPGCVVNHDVPSTATDGRWWMPDEAVTHRRTWMAFGAHREIWADLLTDVHENLALIANTIAEFEPVTMLVRPEDRKLAARLCDKTVELIDAPLDDLWIRDTGPVFVINAANELGAVDLNFNGWGEKQAHTNDAKVAAFVAKCAKATYQQAEIVGEGGGIEVDGHGTAIITESCFLNDNRNPELQKAECETELKKRLGLRKIVWLPGVRGKDITDAHTDFYARFASREVVLAGLESNQASFDYEITRKHLQILQAATDADDRRLRVVPVPSPTRIRKTLETEDFAAGYINFYVVNGGVIAPEFGDKERDAACKAALKQQFPSREIVQLNIDAIAAGGGGIHCATLHEPQPGPNLATKKSPQEKS